MSRLLQRRTPTLPSPLLLLLLLVADLWGASASRMNGVAEASPGKNASFDALGPAGRLRGTPWSLLLSGGVVLGEGGFGKVMRKETKFPCFGSVAVKEVHCCETSCRPRFYNEVLAMESLRHPNIIELYDYFPYNKTRFCETARPHLVMESIDGGEIHTVFRNFFRKYEEPLDLLRAAFSKARKHQRHSVKTRLLLMALVDTLRGLAHIHGMGYLHRDLKPQNIWAVSRDEACVESMSCRFIIGDLGLVIAPEEYSAMDYRVLAVEGLAALPTFEEPSYRSKVTGLEVHSGERFQVSKKLVEQTTGMLWLRVRGFGGGWLPAATEHGAATVEPVKFARFTTQIAGTLQYLPPEALQETGPIHNNFFSGKSDVWALGVSLHEVYLWAAEDEPPMRRVQARTRAQSDKLRQAMQDKTYLPEKLRKLLYNMTSEVFLDRPSARIALIIAEEVMQEEYSAVLPERVPERVPCIDACKEVRQKMRPSEGMCTLTAAGEVVQDDQWRDPTHEASYESYLRRELLSLPSVDLRSD